MVSAASPPWDRVSGTPCHVTFVYQSIAWNFSKINLKRTFFNCSSDTSASVDHRHEWRYTKCSITLHYITYKDFQVNKQMQDIMQLKVRIQRNQNTTNRNENKSRHNFMHIMSITLENCIKHAVSSTHST